jgi:hypothetical protein
MAKFHGPIGYVTSVEVSPGVWQDSASEREYSGDIIRQSKQWVGREKVNDDLVINNRISVIADDFAYSNFSGMKYVVWAGVYWKVSNIEIERPRLILSLGGVYNGTKA